MFNLIQQFDAIKNSLIGYILMLASTVIGLIWISISLYGVAIHYLGPIWGPAAVGGGFLLPILVYLLIKAVKPETKRSQQQSALEAAYAASPAGSLSKMIETMSTHSPFLGTLTAIAGGFVAARFPQFLPIMSELVIAGSDEVKRWNAGRAERKTQKAADATYGKSSYEGRGTPPPPPDVEPVARRKGKSKANSDMY